MLPVAIRRCVHVLGILAVLVSPAVGQLRATLVAGGFSRPVGFVQNPADPAVQVVLEQAGRVRVVRDGVVQTTDFLNLSAAIACCGEQGLLGLAFSPNYRVDGRVFVSFNNRQGHNVIARFTRSAGNPSRADPASRFDFEWPGGERFVEHPFTNHNGGNIAFGPDGFLYVGFGDGGAGNDPFHHAQNPQSLLGKMLRLDVNVSAEDPEGYDVPPTNPFVARPDVRGEIWAFGVRNPWRWSFDDPRRGGTGALVIADVGQGQWEEVNYEPADSGGRNYGWRNREGAHNNVTSEPPYSQPLIDPITEYSHAVGQSITGGFVYRGTALGAGYVGRYFFGDFIASRVWSIALTVNPVTGEASAGVAVEHTQELGAAASSPSSFGVDAAGELYVVNYNGAIYRIDGTPGQSPAPDPTEGPRRRSGDSLGRARPRVN
jgi:glucose/arabinose dehydrogenase